MCEEKHIEYISLTDHDTCKQYQDEILKDNTIFSGKIIKGSELHAMFQNENIEETTRYTISKIIRDM